MGKLTTHVLDTTRGRPGNAIAVSLFRITDSNHQHIKSTVTNDDGRCDEPLLEGDDFQVGIYELVFSVGPYFTAVEPVQDNAASARKPRFLDDVVIRFGISADDEHYHVPLLISPHSYSTYRGS